MMEGPCADSEEKREPAGDIDTVVVDGLKVLDPKRPIREADIVPFLTRPRRPRTIETPLSEGTDGQASHLPWLVRKAEEAAPGADAWS
jgi:hypothetical protein